MKKNLLDLAKQADLILYDEHEPDCIGISDNFTTEQVELLRLTYLDVDYYFADQVVELEDGVATAVTYPVSEDDQEELRLEFFNLVRIGGEQTTADVLLREALMHITDKPWDDSTHLHKRISEHLGRPISYPEWDYS